MDKDQERLHDSAELHREVDTTDAGPFQSNSPDHTCNNITPNISSSSLFSAAGPLLLSPPVFYKTAGDVVKRFTPKRDNRRDMFDIPDEVFQKDDSGSIVFEAEGASNAVKHFFFNALPQEPTPVKDSTDAGGEYGGEQYYGDQSDVASHPQPHLGITSTQQTGTLSIEKCAASDVEDAFRYDMAYPERGCFVIFNHNTFDLYNKHRKEDDRLNDRRGTDKDALNLENAFKQLGFEYVRVVKDATRSDIYQWIDMLSKADFSDYDCFGCAILTHGGDRDILYARDAEMNLKDFTRPFGADRCTTLAGKPKLFFIQACRGVNFDDGGKVPLRRVQSDQIDGTQPGGDAVDGRVEQEVTIPAEADFLIANSTVPEYYSWRNESNGSFFVQALCAILNRYGASMELMQMMTRVNRMVAYDYESSTCDRVSNKKKQIPSIATRLTAEVFFKPKHEDPDTGTQAECSPPPTVSQTTMQVEASVTRHNAEEDYTSSESYVLTTTEISREDSSQRQSSGSSSQHIPPLPPKSKHFYPDPEDCSLDPPRPPGQATNIPQTSQNLNQEKSTLPHKDLSLMTP